MCIYILFMSNFTASSALSTIITTADHMRFSSLSQLSEEIPREITNSCSILRSCRDTIVKSKTSNHNILDVKAP